MKENLFSRATRSALSKLGIIPVFYKLILLPLLCIPLSYGAFQLNEDVSAQAPQGVIYLGDNTIIYGIAHISNAAIVTPEPREKAKRVSVIKNKREKPKQQLPIAKAKENKALKKLQLEISRRVKHNLYSNRSANGLIKYAKTNRITEATTANFVFHFGKGIFRSNSYLNICCLLTEQQKTYLSKSDSQSGKSVISFLRGPPISVYA